MNFNEFLQKLTPENGQIHIQTGTFSDTFSDFLRAHYLAQGSAMLWDSATIAVDEAKQQITVVGKSSFLNIPDLPAEAVFSLDAAGEAQASIRYQLISANETALFWNFAKSFPALPYKITTEGDWKRPIADLQFWEAAYIVSTLPAQEATSQTPIEAGINFVGKAKTPAILGILSNLFQNNADNALNVWGTIRIPTNDLTLYKPVLATDVSEVRLQAWEIPQMHGIHLTIGLEADFAIGGIQCKDTALRLYSPLNSLWADTDELYQPEACFTALMQSGEIAAQLVGNLEEGADGIFVEANFAGLSIRNIAQLAGLSGGNDLTESLPTFLVEFLTGLSQIEILDLAFAFTFGKAGFGLQSFQMQIGVEDANWHLWGDHLVVNGLGVKFAANNLLTQPEYHASFWGKTTIEGVAVDMQSSLTSNYWLTLSLSEGATLPLSAIYKSFAPTSAFTFPDLEIDGLVMTLAYSKTSQFISFTGSLANEPHAWTFEIGKQKLSFSDINFDLMLVKGETDITGSLMGTVALNDQLKLEASFQTPGDFVIKASCTEMHFAEMVERLVGKDTGLPAGMDFTLRDSSVLFKLESQTNTATFQAATRWENVGNFALEIRKADNAWGAAAGIALTDVGKLSDIKELSFLKPFEEVVDLQDFVLVTSSYSGASFQFPNLANFSNPSLTSHNIPMPAQSGGLQQGLNIYAKWLINTDKKELKLLKSILGLDPTLAITLQIGKVPSEFTRLYFKYDSKLAGKYPMQAQFGFAMSKGSPEMFLAGFTEVPIQGEKCRFDVAMSLVKGGVFFSGSMKGTLKFGDLQLSNLALALGFNWGGIPTLGVAANIDLPNFHSSIALLFDSTDPSKSILAGAISDFTLNDIATALASAKDIPDSVEEVLDKIEVKGSRPFTLPASLATAFNEQDLKTIAGAFLQYGKVSIPSTETSVLFVCNQVGEQWSLTDLNNNMRHYQIVKTGDTLTVSLNPQIYLSPKGATLGTIAYPQGYFMTGTLGILGFEWTSYIDIRSNKGIAIQSYMNEALVIYKPQFFKLSASELATDNKDKKAGAKFSLATFSQPELSTPEFRTPHVYLSGRLNVLGLLLDTYIKLSKSGFAIDILQKRTASVSLGGFAGSAALSFEIKANFDSITNFSAGGGIGIDLAGKVDLGQYLEKLGIDLGKISLDLKVAAKVEMGYNGKAAYVRFWGSLTFQGVKRNFDLQLKADNADITKVYENVLDELKKIVKDLFDTAQEWANAVKNGVVAIEKGTEQMVNAFKNAYNQTAEQSLQLAKSVGRDIKEGIQALKNVYNTSAQDAMKFAKNVGAVTADIADGINKTFSTGAKETARLLSQVLQTSPEDIANSLKSVFKLNAEQALQTLKDIGQDWLKASAAIKNAFQATDKEIMQAMNKFGASVEDLSKVLSQNFQKTTDEIVSSLKGLGKGAEEIGKALKSAFNQSAKQVAEALQKVGIDTDSIGKTLQSAFSQSSQDAAQTLQAIGKTGEEVGKALKNVYNQSAEDVSRILGNIGRSLQTVSNTLKTVFNLDAKNAAQVLKNIGKNSKQITEGIKGAFNSSAEDMAKILDQIGFSLDDISGVMKDAYGKSAEETCKIFKSIGKGASDVAKSMKNVYNLSADATGELVGDAYDLGKDAAKDMLKAAGYAGKEIDKWADSAFKSIKKFFSW